MIKYIIDIECDNLLNDVTKIHCLSYCDAKTGVIQSTSNQEEIKNFFLQEDVVFIGHNIICYDIPVAEKIYNISVKAQQWDTLALSWTLFPNMDKHGLETWGNFFNVKKPEILDWQNLSTEDYIYRCSTDVRINLNLWRKQASYLNQLYDGDAEQTIKYIEYLSFKMDCIKEQQFTGIKLDIDLCKSELEKLTILKEEKVNTLKEGMPKKAVKAVKFPPKVMFKANGEPSANRIKWLEFLKENNLPETHNEEVEFIHNYEEPNPNSHDQIKEWLYSLGWIPEHIKHFRDKKKNEVRQIPQIKSKDEEGEICNSIKKLFYLAPALEALDDLFIISHRISVFEGFLKNQKDGKLYQEISGITNTLRFMHKNIVNLPSIFKPYAENIRACLIASDNNHVVLNSDLSGVEDNTKRHYIYQYDPEYVESMSVKGYDPHLELGILSNQITTEESDYYKWFDKINHKEYTPTTEETEKFAEIKQKRHKAKTANFSLTYKVGLTTLSRATGLSEKDAKKLKNAYWDRNKAILDVENSLKIKTIDSQMWLLNPISKFWYSLRAEKDKFSTLNQGTAVYVFDLWVQNVRKQGVEISFQVHDELNANIWKIDVEEIKEIINNSIQKVNNELKLNIQIGCSIQTGFRYSEAH
jgi:hypothetical protein